MVAHERSKAEDLLAIREIKHQLVGAQVDGNHARRCMGRPAGGERRQREPEQDTRRSFPCLSHGPSDLHRTAPERWQHGFGEQPHHGQGRARIEHAIAVEHAAQGSDACSGAEIADRREAGVAIPPDEPARPEALPGRGQGRHGPEGRQSGGAAARGRQGAVRAARRQRRSCAR